MGEGEVSFEFPSFAPEKSFGYKRRYLLTTGLSK